MSQRTSPIGEYVDRNASKIKKRLKLKIKIKIKRLCVTIVVFVGENAEKLLFLAYSIQLLLGLYRIFDSNSNRTE